MSQYVQVAICGIAEDKAFNDASELPTKVIRRKKLAEFIRNKCLLSGRDFARTIDVSPAAITKWLYTDTMPSIRVIRKIATVYGITVEEADGLFAPVQNG
ncbi:MAG: helix-turn-helix domain-containing protein [Corallococcus sp.]|nr:helix-turn-helix domain-containing protein [Corallococcus sp.]